MSALHVWWIQSRCQWFSLRMQKHYLTGHSKGLSKEWKHLAHHCVSQRGNLNDSAWWMLRNGRRNSASWNLWQVVCKIFHSCMILCLEGCCCRHQWWVLPKCLYHWCNQWQWGLLSVWGHQVGEMEWSVVKVCTLSAKMSQATTQCFWLARPWPYIV